MAVSHSRITVMALVNPATTRFSPSPCPDLFVPHKSAIIQAGGRHILCRWRSSAATPRRPTQRHAAAIAILDPTTPQRHRHTNLHNSRLTIITKCVVRASRCGLNDVGILLPDFQQPNRLSTLTPEISLSGQVPHLLVTRTFCRHFVFRRNDPRCRLSPFHRTPTMAVAVVRSVFCDCVAHFLKYTIRRKRRILRYQ
jgi:hypothetical protein